MRICICGGGSLGHVCAGVLSSRAGVELSLLTSRPEQWSSQITVRDPDGRSFRAAIKHISANPEDVIVGQDIILLCLPGFMLEKTLQQIRPFVGKAIVGSIVSSTGFFFFAHQILGKDARVFGFQRVPFIARVEEYGKSARLLGYKKELFMAAENIPQSEEFCQKIEQLFRTPIIFSENIYEVALSNSNPILHTGRLYTIFSGRENKVFDAPVFFYKSWTDDASRLVLAMDEELFCLLYVLDVHGIKRLADYYESPNASALTRKIRSIEAFQTILTPMVPVDGGWKADYDSRYFTEDFPYGLRWIREEAEAKGIHMPNINRVYEWGMKCLTRAGNTADRK